jgi:hypothetical protein
LSVVGFGAILRGKSSLTLLLQAAHPIVWVVVWVGGWRNGERAALRRALRWKVTDENNSEEVKTDLGPGPTAEETNGLRDRTLSHKRFPRLQRAR